MTRLIGIACATLLLTMQVARAEDSEEVLKLKEAKALLEAQAARDAAEAAAIRAAAELAKARAAAAAATRDVEQSQAAANAKALLETQAARDAAEAAAIRASVDLGKAKAATDNAANEIRKAQNESQAALTASEVAAQTAMIGALKTAFGNVPTVGSDGNITITDATSGVLLQTKAGSLDATWQLAESLCKRLTAAGVKGTYVAPVDVDSKVQSARMVLREFFALSEKVGKDENRTLVGLSGAQAQVAPAAVLSAAALLQYGAGALQQTARLFRADYAVALSSDATRAAWLEYFMAAQCPGVLPLPQVETVIRRQSLDAIVKRLDEMQEFHTAAVARKIGIQKQIELLTGRIADLKAKKEDTSALEGQLKVQNDSLAEIVKLDAWLPRIQALITSVSTSTPAFLDAVTYIAFSSETQLTDSLLSKETKALALPGKPRLTMVLTTQDGQITSTFWLTGKKVYGRSSAELIYRVAQPDGKVSAAGYLTAQSSVGVFDFSAEQPTTIRASHYPPSGDAGAVRNVAVTGTQ